MHVPNTHLINQTEEALDNIHSKQAGHVFFSYARSDFSDCEKIKNALEQAGINCWLDTEDIKPGEKWLPSLQKALHQAQAMVVVCSEAAKKSDYMELEFHQAKELELTIIPVIIEGQEVPFHLTNLNAIFLSGDWQAGINQLIGCFSAKQTQRETELAWLHMLEQKLESLYTPLQGESRQSQKKQVQIPKKMVQHSALEHLAHSVAKELPEKKQQYEDIQSAFSQISRAVLLGEPGAGKSTTLRKLASDQVERAKTDPDAAIPLFVSLGKWRDAEQSFSAFLQQQLGSLGPYLQTLLHQNHAILLLDGLNETPTDVRENKAEQLKQWLQQEDQSQLVCYVSCRDLDYTGMNLEMDRIRIQPLDPPRIRAFLQDYLPLMMGEAGIKAALDLFWSLGGGEPLRETWEAWQRAGATEKQFWHSDEIPRKDPDVYTKITPKHDEIWHNALHNSQSLLKLAANPFMLSMLAVVYATNETLPKNRAGLFSEFIDTLLNRENLLQQQGLLLSSLQQLAWAMQEQRDNKDNSVQTTLPRYLALKHVDEQILLQAARANLLDAGDDVRFSHQLLQEYFTALMMQEKLEKNELDANSLWPTEQFWKPSGWEEATVLLAGLYEPDCSVVLNWLLPVHPEMLVRCIRETAVPYQDGIPGVLQQHWQEAMLDSVAPEARASIARALGIMELDKRVGVGLNKQGLPDIDWVRIPEGSIFLEENAGTFPVEPFDLARYPVTNAQFQCFIDDPEGYANPLWWQKLEEQSTTPDTPRWTEANNPRETVSWYEAMAFCAWLSERLEKNISLPTEWQWQQAACSGDPDFNYPWGKKYKSGHANIDETEESAGPHYIERTTAVGIYPLGDSVQGVSDLSGNVWEWCLNSYDEPEKMQSSGTFWRVLRGGSLIYGRDGARASFRDRGSPDDRDDDIGFRVCCVSTI